MENLALGHSFGSYEDAQQNQTADTTQQKEFYQENLNLINQERINFSRTMKATGKFILFMCLSGGAVFISRILPIFSFAGFAVRFLMFAILAKEAIFNHDERERRDFQLVLLAVGLGNLGAEWDVWLSISQAVSDFFTLYGALILAGFGVAVVVIVCLLFRGNNEAPKVNSLNAYNNYSTEEYNDD
jgi:hypothetical protein